MAATLPPTTPPAVRACVASQLNLVLDPAEGAFAGMSKNGGFVTIRNVSAKPCSLRVAPELTFATASGAPIRVARDDAAHPPAGVVNLPARGTAWEAMLFVTSNVFDHGTCVTPATFAVIAGGDGKPVRARFDDQLCGESATYSYQAKPLTTVKPEGTTSAAGGD